MKIRVFILTISVLLSCLKSFPQGKAKIQNIEAAMRLIGHELLLESGDSTSLVSPITLTNNKFEIRFTEEFTFEPEVLNKIVDRVLIEEKLSTEYFLEIEECNTKDIVYNYKKNHPIGEKNSNDLLPCMGRIYPKGCYAIFIYIQDLDDSLNSNEIKFNESKNEEISYAWIWLLAILILLVGIYYFFRSRSTKNTIEVQKESFVQIGKYKFDTIRSQLILEEQLFDLTSKEADLLSLLFSNKNNTVNKEVILEKVWGDSGDYVGRTLDVYISKLRKKLSADESIKISNVRGVGYKLVHI